MATRTRKSTASDSGKIKAIADSDEEMQSLATSLGRGLALAVDARKLLGVDVGKKPSKQDLKKLHAITQSVADAAPPPLSPEAEV